VGIDEHLIGSWDLALDGRDASGRGHHATTHGTVAFGPSGDATHARSVARIEHGAGHLEVPGIAGLGITDFTIGMWVNASTRSTAALGDLAASFDPATRRGFTLGFQHRTVCGSHCNDRNLLFGLDDGRAPRWTDHGSPSEAAVMIYALVVHEDHLYAATWEESPTALGHVYRLEGDEWVDCGVPWDANAVTRLAVHDGRLYAGVSRVMGGGSGRPDSSNQNPGGRVLRYEGGTEWSDCGQLEGADSVGGLVAFDGSLYAIPIYSEGLYRMDSPGTWTWCGTPGRRLLALGVHAGALYGAGNDHKHVVSAIEQTRAGVVVAAESSEGGGGVFRYDGGERWTSLGLQRDTTQVYSFETHGGELYISTWPTGLVFRLGASGQWESTGRLGDETEVMALASFNGMLYAGTLPHAQVYRHDGDEHWSVLRQLDATPDVLYRRAHAMGVYRGALYCGTLPAATVHSLQAGLAVSHDQALGAGWRHIAATRDRGTISLYVDGSLVATRSDDDAGPPIDLGAPGALWLGGGPQAGLDGELANVRLYDRALAPDAIRALATEGLI
jgi:Concanavalin A-like lectin/glucanases superfamily